MQILVLGGRVSMSVWGNNMSEWLIFTLVSS
jgi:hypothetical protein